MDYEKQANDFLKKTNVGFKAEFVEFGKHFENDKEDRAIFNITLSKGERVFSFRFGQSIVNSGFCFPKYTDELNKKLRDSVNFRYGGTDNILKTEEKFLRNAKEYFGSLVGIEYYKFKFPSAYDVLSGLQKYAVDSFDDFCADFGYSNDSISAQKIFRAVQKEFDMVRQLWSDEEILLLCEVE